MKRFASSIISAFFAVALSSPVWAQQRDQRGQSDLDVTISVVPANSLPGAVTGPIALPNETAEKASDGNAQYGLETANQARARKEDLDRDFVRGASEAARERALERIQNIEQPTVGRP